MSQRYFEARVQGSDKSQGVFSGLTPKQAAHKASMQIARNKELGQNTKTTIKFSLTERTKGVNNNKTYFFECERRKLETPLNIQTKDIDGKTKNIEYVYQNSIKNDSVEKQEKIEKEPVTNNTEIPKIYI